jgi:hypothetical protein
MLKDAEALGTDADRAKARGFVERAGMVVCAGLPKTEMEELGRVVGLSRREIELVSSWSSPPGWGVAGEHEEPPGRGRFLIKVGGRPGIPIKVAITDAERRLHNTNTRWTPNEDAVEQAVEQTVEQVRRAAEQGTLPAVPGADDLGALAGGPGVPPATGLGAPPAGPAGPAGKAGRGRRTA